MTDVDFDSWMDLSLMLSNSSHSLTNKCSKSVRVQFLEDDGAGGSVSLEYLGGREEEGGGGEREQERQSQRNSF